MTITGYLVCMGDLRDWRATTALEFLAGALDAIDWAMAWNRSGICGTYCKVRVDISVRDGERFARTSLLWVDLGASHEANAERIEAAIGRLFN